MAKAVCKKAYRWSFFFWLDLISTISLLLDIPSLQVCTQYLLLAGCRPYHRPEICAVLCFCLRAMVESKHLKLDHDPRAVGFDSYEFQPKRHQVVHSAGSSASLPAHPCDQAVAGMPHLS